MTEIEAKKINIGDLFSDNYRFKIPIFQRPLSWKVDNFDELFEDIYNAFKSNQDEYFLGSIILQQQENNLYDIIDGQQRLVTIGILLAVIRDNTNKKDVINSIENSLYQKKDEYKELPAVPRIKFWEDLSSLESYVYGPKKTNEYVKNVEEGKEKYKDRGDPKYSFYQVISLYTKKYHEKLKDNDEAGKFLKYLYKNVYVVCVSTKSLPYAIQLFNVLNTRGLPLTTADILKAINLSKIEESEREKWSKKWREIENNIGREEVEKVIEFIRTLKLKTKAKTSIYEEYNKEILDKLINKGKEFIEYLERISNIYRDLVLEPENLKVDNEYKNLVTLMRDYIPFDDWIPSLIAFYEKFYNNREIKKSINDYLPHFLRKLEKKTVIEWVIRFTPTQRIMSLNEVIKLIEKENEPENVISGIDDPKIKKEMKSKFESEINSRDFYYENFSKYLLLRIDLKKWDQENFPGYRGLITIEHILPQEPLENSDWTKKFDKEQREEWTNKIGNLVLLSRRKNSRAKNYDFKKKKEAYFFKDGKTPFVITQELEKIDEWNLDALKNRHEKLVNELIEIYFGE